MLGGAPYKMDPPLRYKCGPYAKFQGANGLYEEATVECQWNKTWAPPSLERCFCKFALFALYFYTL